MRASGCVLGVLFAVGLAACAPVNISISPGDYANQVTDGTVALYWNCLRAEPAIVAVRGVANNPYYAQPIKDLTLTLYGVDAMGGTVSQAQGSAQAFLIQLNNPTTFEVTLQTVGGEVRYDLAYSYTFGGGHFMSSGGDQRNLKMNACPSFR